MSYDIIYVLMKHIFLCEKIDIKAYVVCQKNICQSLYNLQKTYTKTLEISKKICL